MCLRDQLCPLNDALLPSVQTQRHRGGRDLPVLAAYVMCVLEQMGLDSTFYYRHLLLFLWSLRDLKSFTLSREDCMK